MYDVSVIFTTTSFGRRTNCVRTTADNCAEMICENTKQNTQLIGNFVFVLQNKLKKKRNETIQDDLRHDDSSIMTGNIIFFFFYILLGGDAESKLNALKS